MPQVPEYLNLTAGRAHHDFARPDHALKHCKSELASQRDRSEVRADGSLKCDLVGCKSGIDADVIEERRQFHLDPDLSRGRALLPFSEPPLGLTEITTDAVVEGDEIRTRDVTASERRRVPLRKIFMQIGTGNKVKHGVLTKILHRHDRHALDLYLLALALATKAPFEVSYESGMWGRAIGLTGKNSSSTVSRTWKRLTELKLIARGRRGRKAQIRLLNEVCDGSNYTPPGLTKGDVYVQIPLAYWLDGYHATLTLPAKAMLLVLLSLPENYPLPMDRMPKWYGVSADSADRGLRELRNRGLIDRTPQWQRTPLTGSGFTKTYRYNLRAPFRRQRSAAK